MKKVFGVFGVLLLAAAFLALPAPAKAEMYVEAYLGGVGASNIGDNITNTYPTIPGLAVSGNVQGLVSASVIGGLKIGTWFVPTGFLGCNYPDWMKYLGFYTDFSYHRLDTKRSNFTGTMSFGGVPFGAPLALDSQTEGTVATWAFMFAARYGFFPDSEVPFGRLQPYVAVGPAVMFSTQQPQVRFANNGPGLYSPDSQSSVDIALAVDAGIRYMCLKNVSIDLSFKYRWANPSYEFTGFENGFGAISTVKYSPTYNLFSGQLGVAYHF